ncbi:choline-sulfatase [Alphaproteobacteria bacterium]|nr:choline-sulfatase [Alphaproteobacteria bacterium]
MTAQQPNIVLIMADQLAPQFTSSYGHPVVKTPHMDRLAERGMRFDSAYCNAPLCAPSRFSFMSGQLVTRIAAYDNASEFLSSIPTFAHYLRGMGYRTCLSGKMHFVGPDQLHGFDERITTDIYPSDFAWTPDWELADERIDKWYHNMDSVREAGVAQTTFQIEYDEEVAFFARRKLFEYAAEKQHPFCMVASFIHPHDPYVARPEWWDLYDHDAIDMPALTIPFDQQDGFSRRLMDGIEASTIVPSDDDIRNARHAYYANTSYFDSKVGHIVQTLEECGQLDNTIVIVTADHGDMLGERSLWYKMNFFEHSARVPLIMAGPGVHNGAVNSPCSLVDILPTMLDIAQTDQTPTPSYGQPIDGRSLWGMATTGAEDHGVAIGEYCAEMTAHPVIMIRRGDYKYIYCPSDAPMLFNIASDPRETTNLADDPDHIELAQQFAAEIAAGWDMDTIRHDVIAKQKQRQAVYQAMQSGKRADWDYNPPRHASEEYVRNHMDWTEAAAKTRFPPLEEN